MLAAMEALAPLRAMEVATMLAVMVTGVTSRPVETATEAMHPVVTETKPSIQALARAPWTVRPLVLPLHPWQAPQPIFRRHRTISPLEPVVRETLHLQDGFRVGQEAEARVPDRVQTDDEGQKLTGTTTCLPRSARRSITWRCSRLLHSTKVYMTQVMNRHLRFQSFHVHAYQLAGVAAISN